MMQFNSSGMANSARQDTGESSGRKKPSRNRHARQGRRSSSSYSRRRLSINPEGGVKRSGRSIHRYEALRRSQERLAICVIAGMFVGLFAGFIVGNFIGTIGTGLALGLAFGIVAAS